MAQAQAMPLPRDLRLLVERLSAAEVADDQEWILSLMRQEGLVVLNLLWRMLGSQEDVLDAYQTAVCRLAAHGPQTIASNRSGYFYRTAMNAGIEILRIRKRRQAHWPAIRDVQARRTPPLSGTEAFDHREMLDQMRQAICQLPPYLRNVVILHDLSELPYGRVAGLLGIRTGTARLYRHQAIVRLGELIAREAAS